MNFWRDIVLNTIYPNVCYGCNKRVSNHLDIFCIQCNQNIQKTDFHNIKDNLVYRKLIGLFPISAASSFLLVGEGSLGLEIIHQIKYQNKPELAKYMGQWYGEELKSTIFQQTDTLIPIPLHSAKIEQRGFNQSEYFALGLSDSLGPKTNSKAVIRNKYTVSQTKLSREDRRKNVSGVFEVLDPKAIQGQRITIIDDVITTGATIEMFAEALMPFKPKDIKVLTLGMAINS